MSDVVVSVTESTTAVTVTEQDVAVAVTETSVDVSSSTAGIQGATGATGAGYSGVTSTSTITIGSGLKTFTLVSANQGAFLTGMRIRAIHSDTPTYYMEGTANYVGAGTLIITVDKFNGSGSHNSWAFAVAGEVGQTGSSGLSGVVSVTSPITNTGTSGSAIVGIDQTLLALSQSQVTSLTTDLAGKASLGAANAFTVGGHVISNAATAVVPLALKAVASQSANTLELQNSSGSPITYFTASGRAVIGSDSSAMLNVVANATAVIPVVIKGASGQSADLVKIQNSSGVDLVRVDSAGRGIFPTVLAGALTASIGVQMAVQPTAATTPGFAVRGAASQSANLQEWQDSAGGTVASVTSTGIIRSSSFRFNANNGTLEDINGVSPYVVFTTGNIRFDARTSTFIPLVVRGVASQSANLQEWQNSGGTAIASISSTGAITTTAAIRAVALQGTSDGLSAITTSANRNLQFFSATTSIGGGAGVLGITNATTVPSSNPTGGGILYVEAGALKYRGSSGTITTLGAA